MANLQEKSPLISVVVVNYQTENYVEILLKSLGVDRRLELIVVDNSNSKNLSITCKKYKNTIYIPLDKNEGFSKANNIGIKKARTDWVFLLNSDTETTPIDILAVCEKVKSKSMLVGAPQLQYENGTVQNSVAYFDALTTHPVNFIFGRPRFLDCKNIAESTTVDFAVGGALLIHRKVFDTIGLLDENNFFVYFEDLDFCQRLKKHAISILYIPEISIIHHEGQSSNQNKTQKSENYNFGLKQYLIKHRGYFIYLLNTIFHFLS